MIGYVRPDEMWTDVDLRAEPELLRLTAELGVALTGVGFQLPASYPGVVRILHNHATASEKARAREIAAAHGGITAQERAEEARLRARSAITKDDLLEALLDPAAAAALRARLA